MRDARNFDMTYRELLYRALTEGISETNIRTGKGVRVLPGAIAFLVDLRNGLLPVPDCRRVFPKTPAAETAWNILGHDHTAWLRKYTKIWEAFTTEYDCICTRTLGSNENCSGCGGTGKVPHLEFAYGSRWRRAFGRDQLADACKALREDRSNRRVWVTAWNAGHDGLDREGQKNVPCPVGFNMTVVGGMLHLAVMMRSSDMFVGLPYDVMNYAMLGAVLATEVGWQLGSLHFTLANAHVYDDHHDMAWDSLSQKPVRPRVVLLETTMRQVVDKPDAFVEYYMGQSARTAWPAYSPKPAVAL